MSIRQGSAFQVTASDVNQRFYDLYVGHLTSIAYKTRGIAQNRNCVNAQLKGLLEIQNSVQVHEPFQANLNQEMVQV